MTQLRWKPLLAASLPQGADLRTLPYPLYASPKLDGVRCMIQAGVPISRNFKAFRNRAVAEKFGGASFEGLDGELTIGFPYGPYVYNRTAGCLNSGKPDAYETAMGLLRFNVFDCFMKDGAAFKERLYALNNNYCNQGVQIVGQKLIRNAAALTAYEDQCLAKGYEGVMLRKHDSGPYPQKKGKDTRSTLREWTLVKFKRFDYGFAIITDIHPLKHNLNEERTATGRRSSKRGGITVDSSKIGSVTVKDTKTGAVFALKVATDELQSWFGWRSDEAWKGQVVRYKFQLIGSMDGVPRFPTADFNELVGV